MAGFDFNVAFDDKTLSSTKTTVLYIKRQALGFDLAIGYRKNNRSHYKLTVDGGLIDMQLFGLHLSSVLSAFMEGAQIPSFDDRAAAIIEAYSTGFQGIDGFVKDIALQMAAVSPTATPNTLVFDYPIPLISKRVDSFTHVALSFAKNKISPETYLEEFHGLIEFLGQNLLNKTEPSYDLMVRKLVDLEFLDPRVANDITRYKNIRKDIKHRRGNMPKKELSELLGRTVSIIHILVSRNKDHFKS